MARQVIAVIVGALGAMIESARVSAASTAIVPGMLVEENAGKVREHSTAGGNAQKLFALENLPVGGTIDTAYAAGASVRYGAAHSGQLVNALVAASATAIADGVALMSAGDGTLELYVAQAADVIVQSNRIVAYAVEAVNNSGGATSVRILARVA